MNLLHHDHALSVTFGFACFHIILVGHIRKQQVVGVVHFVILVSFFFNLNMGSLFIAGRSDAGKKKNTENIASLILNLR